MKKVKLSAICITASMLLASCANGTGSDNNTNNIEDTKETLILACPASVEDWYLNVSQKEDSDRLINLFNSTNEKYEIQKKEYETSEKFLLDIMTDQQQFDLLYVGDWIDMTPMYSKGLLCDIYELIDADDEVSRDMYVEPVLDVLEINGKLYQMPYDYIIQTAVAKSEVWGDETDNSIEHLIERSEQLGFDAPFDFSLYSVSLFSFITSEFVDFNSGTCSFNDGRFEEVLRMMKKYNDIYGNEAMNYPNGAVDLCRDDRVMIISTEFTDISQLSYLTTLIGARIKCVGYPSSIQNYHIAVPVVSFAVFENSENKEGAFEFIKYYTSYDIYFHKFEYNNGATIITQGALPINKAALEHKAELSLEDSAFAYPQLDEQICKEYCDETLEHIYTVNGVGSYIGKTAKSILTEEIPYYLNGDKTAAEVCDMIQNRFTVYLNEQMK